MENQRYWPEMQRQMMQKVEVNRPAYLVLVEAECSWQAEAGSPQDVAMHAWLDRYVSRGFEQAGVVDLNGPDSHYYWDDDAAGHRFAGHELIIYKRKD